MVQTEAVLQIKLKYKNLLELIELTKGNLKIDEGNKKLCEGWWDKHKGIEKETDLVLEVKPIVEHDRFKAGERP